MKNRRSFLISVLLFCLPMMTAFTSCNKPEEIIPPNYALQFDGLDGRVVFENTESLSPTNAITISMLVRLEASVDCDAADNQVGLLNKGYPTETNSGYRIHVNEDGAVGMEVGTEGGYVIYGTGRGLDLNRWTFLTFVYDAATSEASIYWNGQLNTDGGYGDYGQGPMIPNFEPLQLNTEAFSTCTIERGNFPGSIDDLSIWNIALSQQEIKDMMNQGLTGTETDLISYWPFDEGSDSTAVDISSLNNGSIKGGTDWIIR